MNNIRGRDLLLHSKENRVSVALIHYPVLDKQGQIYTTSVTNVDVHDIARSAKTYGLSAYYIVTPIAAQRELASSIKDFWVNGPGIKRNIDRHDAIDIIKVVSSLEEAITMEDEIAQNKTIKIATSAKIFDKQTISYSNGKEIIDENKSSMIILGTGYGLWPDLINNCDYVLEPIYGKDGYNHLSVRSAAAIIFDRLFGYNVK